MTINSQSVNELEITDRLPKQRRLRMKHINQYFFGVDRISISDALWFYGGLIVMIVIGLICL